MLHKPSVLKPRGSLQCPSIVWRLSEIASFLTGVPARFGLGGEHRAFAGAASARCRQEPEQVPGVRYPESCKRGRDDAHAEGEMPEASGQGPVIGIDGARAELDDLWVV